MDTYSGFQMYSIGIGISGKVGADYVKKNHKSLKPIIFEHIIVTLRAS